MRFSDSQRLDWLRLIRSDHVGPITFHELIAEFGSAGAALEALPSLAARGGRREYRAISRAAAEAELEAALQCGATPIALPEAPYPPLLRQIASPPPIIYVKGSPGVLSRRAIAIVGSRNASALGQSFARSLACDLGAAGLTIISGLARGIDTAAHWASLPTGAAAVLAGGVDVLYPPENGALYDALAEKGALLSELPPGFQPRGQDFPRRNRLISGLSLGVVVVEAARQSGSLITARFALEQNREVFAVPGHPLDPRAAGANMLIRSGAHLLSRAQDVLDALTPEAQPGYPGFAEPDQPQALAPSAAPPDGPFELTEADRTAIRDALSFAPVTIDVLAAATGLPQRAVNIALLELDLAGKLDRNAPNCVCLKP